MIRMSTAEIAQKQEKVTYSYIAKELVFSISLISFYFISFGCRFSYYTYDDNNEDSDNSNNDNDIDNISDNGDNNNGSNDDIGNNNDDDKIYHSCNNDTYWQ